MPTIQQLVRKGREVLVEKSKSPVSCEQFHDLCPPSFWFAASAQRVVAFQFLRCRRVLVDGTRFKQAVYFRLPVAAFTAKHDITDALLAAHTLEGAGTHVKQVRRLACGEQPVGRCRFLVAGGGTDVCRNLRYLFRQ